MSEVISLSFVINRNMRCIEIFAHIDSPSCYDWINRNMRCIEIALQGLLPAW